jgi:hypothetical protein
VGIDLALGEPTFDTYQFADDQYIRPVVEPVSVEGVHCDKYEWSSDSSHRSMSLQTFSSIRDCFDSSDRLCTDLQLRSYKKDVKLIPVSQYAPRLDGIKQSAETADHIDQSYAQVVLWFVRWSRYVEEEFGECGAFQVPMEWRS